MITAGCSVANDTGTAVDDGIDDDVAGIAVVDNSAAVVSTAAVDADVEGGGADVVSTAAVDADVEGGGADVVSTAVVDADVVDGAVVGCSAPKQLAFEL